MWCPLAASSEISPAIAPLAAVGPRHPVRNDELESARKRVRGAAGR